MSVPAHELQISVDEYLRLERKSDVRHEYVSGRVFSMVGATQAHDAIVVNLTVLIGSAVKNSGSRLFSSDMKVRIAKSESFYYPDLMVSCEPFLAKGVFIEAPCLIVEVLSPSTSDIDRREKLLAYKSLSSLKEYAIVYQEERRVEIYARAPEDWQVSVYTGTDSFFLSPLKSTQISVSLNDIYAGVME